MKMKKYIFPDYFSETAIIEIKKNGQENSIPVYRVGKYGKDRTKSFLNYYEEVILGLKTVFRKESYLNSCKTNINKLSVSCYYDIEDIKYYFEITLKDSYPEKVLLYGETDYNYGLSQKTLERKKDPENSHVDWWLFKNATPWQVFNEVEL